MAPSQAKPQFALFLDPDWGAVDTPFFQKFVIVGPT